MTFIRWHPNGEGEWERMVDSGRKGNLDEGEGDRERSAGKKKRDRRGRKEGRERRGGRETMRRR